MKIAHRITTILALCCACGASALTFEEAKALYTGGAYADALPGLEQELQNRPTDVTINLMTGTAMVRLGRLDEARPLLEYALKKRNAEAALRLAELNFYAYNPEEAEANLENYRTLVKKSRKKPLAEADEIAGRIDRLSSMMDRVEKIVIIDSIAVDRATFFEAYRLSPESGAFYSPSTLPAGFAAATSTVVYSPENAGSMIWCDGNGLVESTMLTDGSWETPHSLGDAINDGGTANYPFLMSDGITLYYATDGESSLGGLDINISRRDDNGFLAPQNIGMPYNSPYDDYLLAIDEVTGTGWWATDRNQLGDKVTIYVFIPADLRINYAPDEDRLADFARITNFRDTWTPDTDYSAILDRIDNIDRQASAPEPDFLFPLPGGRVYHNWSDFRSSAARTKMEALADATEADSETRAELASLRRQYADGNRGLSTKILQLEQQLESNRTMMATLRNDIIELEQNQ